METKKDWNAVFAQRKAARDLGRSKTLSQSKLAAEKTKKKPFNKKKFKKIYIKINPDDIDKLTPWETLLNEAEYDYYVTYKDIMTMEELANKMKWDQGWG